MPRQEYKDVDKIFRENESYEEYSKFCDKFQKHPVSCSVSINLDLKSDGNIMKFDDISMIISRYHRKKKYIIRLIGSETEFDEFMRENANKTIKNYYTAYYGTVCVVTSVATYIIDSFYNDCLEETKWAKRNTDAKTYFSNKLEEEIEKIKEEKEKEDKKNKGLNLRLAYTGNREQYDEDPRFFFAKYATKPEIKDAFQDCIKSQSSNGVLTISGLISKLSEMKDKYGDLFISSNGHTSVRTKLSYFKVFHRSIMNKTSKPYPDSDRNFYEIATVEILDGSNDKLKITEEQLVVLDLLTEILKRLPDEERVILKQSINDCIDQLAKR